MMQVEDHDHAGPRTSFPMAGMKDEPSPLTPAEYRTAQDIWSRGLSKKYKGNCMALRDICPFTFEQLTKYAWSCDAHPGSTTAQAGRLWHSHCLLQRNAVYTQ